MKYCQESLTFLLFVLPFLVLLFIHKWVSQNSTTKKNLPPSPPRLPLIGNLHQLSLYPYRSLQSLSKKYGDIMLLRLGSKPTIIISSPELASLVLKTHDVVFANRPNLTVFKRLLGNGNDVISSPYDERWRRLKSICVYELLSKNKVESYSNMREEEVDLMVKEIERLRVVDLSDMFRSITNDLICRVAFGRKYRGDDENGVDFNKLLLEFVDLLGGHYVGDFVSWLGWIDWINGVNYNVNRVAKTFDVFIERIFQERGEGNIHKDKDAKVVKDFVDILLDIQRQNSCKDRILDKHNIKGLILDIFAASTEAVCIALEWVMSELLRNRRVMEELRKEVIKIMGNQNRVTEDDLKNMNYLKAVLKETLRLHTPAPFVVPHECTRDVEINGFHIVKGTQVVVNAWSICRDLRYWEEPEKFYPERFLDSPIDFKGHDFEFIPFGSGRRMCPGIGLATSVIELVIANLIHQFEWSLPDGKESKCLDIREAPGLIMRKKMPLFAIASPITSFK